MRLVLLLAVAAVVQFPSCGAWPNPAGQPRPLSGERKTAVESAVRTFMLNVARNITSDGPTDWERFFADDPAFFMAVNGQMAFPNRRAATQGIRDLPRLIQKIELRWGDDLRVDPLAENLAVVAASYHELLTSPQGRQIADDGFFTAVAEFGNGRWQFRNAHWSDPLPPAATR